jgi:hypothetical protein
LLILLLVPKSFTVAPEELVRKLLIGSEETELDTNSASMIPTDAQLMSEDFNGMLTA